MPGRLQVQLSMNVFIDDEQAMRDAAMQRLRAAWSGDDEFPYSTATDIPFDEVVHSLVADAVPLDLPGCRRSALHVEVGERVEDTDQDGTSQSAAADDATDREHEDDTDREQDDDEAGSR
jgi:hypothetical protein